MGLVKSSIHPTKLPFVRSCRVVSTCAGIVSRSAKLDEIGKNGNWRTRLLATSLRPEPNEGDAGGLERRQINPNVAVL